MSKRNEKKIEDISQLLSMAGTNLNILEEEVDIKAQKQYFEMQGALSKEAGDYQEICKQYLENINDLFDEAIDEDVKKRMLVVLATIDDVSVYRAIESFSKQKIASLRKWAVIALQQSRMLIQSNLLDDPGVFISTGLGGQGSLLRYFCVFVNRKAEPLEEFQQNILSNELEAGVAPLKGSIEQVKFAKTYTTVLLLLPLDTDLYPLFTGIIDECNTFGNFLHENMIVTNVKKLTAAEIRTMLRTRDTQDVDL